jgi:hypothetical protein
MENTKEKKKDRTLYCSCFIWGKAKLCAQDAFENGFIDRPSISKLFVWMIRNYKI